MDAFYEFRDVLLQIAVHDPDDRLVLAAEHCLEHHNVQSLIGVMSKVHSSPYGDRLRAAYYSMMRGPE